MYQATLKPRILAEQEGLSVLSYNFFISTGHGKKSKLYIPPGTSFFILIKHGEFCTPNSSQEPLTPGCYFGGPRLKSIILEPKKSGQLIWLSLPLPFFYAISGVPMNLFKNSIYPLSQILPSWTCPETTDLNLLDRQKVYQWLSSNLLDTASSFPIPEYIYTSLALLKENQSPQNINRLCAELRIHRRSLERKFQQIVGISPKCFFKVYRIQKILKFLRKSHEPDIHDIIYTYGYFDQSHFIREFKSFVGLTPKQYLATSL